MQYGDKDNDKGFLLPFLLLLLSLVSQPCHAQQPAAGSNIAPPRNLRILEEHKDKNGYVTRVVQYLQGQMRVTETIITPPAPRVFSKPILPDTMNKDSVVLVVEKSGYVLKLYYRKMLIRAYKAVFGPRPLENKCLAGDRCTPEGWFKIVSKNAASKYCRFLGLNYPNDSSYAVFNRMQQQGALPKTAKIGGDVGIHGTWKNGEDMIDLGVGWTDGCIALKNKDVEELFNMVQVGTRVYIKK